MHITFTYVVIYFAVYSVLGWLCEGLYCSAAARKWVNRGLLHGPYCPIYGFGALVIICLLLPLRLHPALLCVSVFITLAALEYFTNWLLEKVFGLRLWDYSSKKFNLNGRVCLQNSALFGILGILLAFVIHPAVLDFILLVPENIARITSSAFIMVFLVDFLVTMGKVADLKGYLARMKADFEELQAYAAGTSWLVPGDTEASVARVNEQRIAAGKEAIPEDVAARIKSGAEKHANRRLLSAFPTMIHRDYAAPLEHLWAVIERERQLSAKRREAVKLKWHGFATAQLREVPAEKAGAQTKKREESFAHGVNFYKLCWVFLIACVIGFLVETIYCIVTTGRIESRQGLIYGPFSQVYGFGAVLMVLALVPLSKYKNGWIFLGSAFIGGGFEWVCSFMQEVAFNSTSWDYTQDALSIGGRTSVMYMIFWGFLGLFFVRVVYPWLSGIIERIPNRQGRVLTMIVIAVLCLDMLVSAAAVTRWSERDRGIPAANAAAEYIDEKYPDDFMQTVYPNMNMKRP